ncbi:hypothetical protein HDU87_000510 [Geranomyces variabilis]|uniref:Uncharacterized protein n=1 Tax=Geranomyces variabilis TaxID=109894 RepID=A0AAD5TCC6_9FUNG|nr:hypothetical protein HDU87_000510 [Geranomyces variabilis]
MDGIITALAARTAAHLRAPDPSTSITHDPLFAALARELSALEKRVARLVAAVRAEHDALEQNAATTLTVLAEQKCVLEHMLANVPRHLPKVAARAARPRVVMRGGDAEGGGGREGKMLMTPVVQRGVEQEGGGTTAPIAAMAAEPSLAVAGSKGTPPKKQPPIPRAVVIQPVTVAEFECLAKYQVGRLTRDKLNDTLAELAVLITDKQAQLRVAPSRMNKRQRELLWEHRKLEPAVVQAISSDAHSSSPHPPPFVTEADVRDKAWFSRSAFRLDPHGRAVVGILRHLGRVKEVRGGGHTRIVVM